MDLDDIVLVVDAQMPVRAKRIKYYEDRFFQEIFDRQAGDLPYPSATDQMRGLQGQIKAMEQKISALQVPARGDKKGARRPEVQALIISGKENHTGVTPDVGAYQNATARVDQFLEKAADD